MEQGNSNEERLLSNDQEQGEQSTSRGVHVLVSDDNGMAATIDKVIQAIKDYGLGVLYALATFLSFLSVLLVYLWFKMDGFSFESEDGDPTKIFSYHPLFMIIGFVLFFAQGSIAFRVLPYFKISRPNIKLIHMTIHFSAIVFTSVGLYAVFKYHSDAGISHMYSLHSWIGIGTFSLFILQYIIGYVSFYAQYPSPQNRAAILPHHKLLGIPILLTLIAVSIATGIIEKLTFGRYCTSPDIGNSHCAYGNSLGIVIIFLFTILLYIFSLR